MHDVELKAALVCLLFALIVGAVVWVALEYVFKVAWARAAGAIVFLLVFALCWL